MVQKVAVKLRVQGWASSCDDLITLCQPNINGYLFRIREGKDSKRRGMGSTFHQLSPRYSGILTLHCSFGSRIIFVHAGNHAVSHVA